MLDINYIRDNEEAVRKAILDKGLDVNFDTFLRADKSRKVLLQKVEQYKSMKNDLNEIMKNVENDEQRQEVIEKGKKIKSELEKVEPDLAREEKQFKELLAQMPNIPSEDTPIGKSEDENVVVYEWGEKPDFSFAPKNHWDLAQQHDWIDKERAAKVAGARFAYLKGDLVLMQLALTQYVMQTLSDQRVIEKIIADLDISDISPKPFVPVLPPYMIKTKMYDAMDRLEPQDDRYKIEDEDLWLQGSAEHVLGAMHQGEIFEEKDLPLRYIGYATSFRREAGTYGKDMEGIIRMHQFDKLEMEIIATPQQGLNEHFLTIAVQEYFLRDLKIPYRKLLKCTADIGKPNVRGVDMDAWLPGQDAYRETHTADYMTDYQARRLKTRVRLEDDTLAYVHTIDATAFACGRALVAIIENYQQEDRSILVPEVLQPFMPGGKKVIDKK